MKERMTEIIGMQIHMLQEAVNLLNIEELTTMSAWLARAIETMPTKFISGE